MATGTYRDLCPSSRRVGMMLQNLSACEVKIPPKTVVSNVQKAEIVPNMKALTHACEVLQWSKKDHQRLASLPAQILLKMS